MNDGIWRGTQFAVKLHKKEWDQRYGNKILLMTLFFGRHKDGEVGCAYRDISVSTKNPSPEFKILVESLFGPIEDARAEFGNDLFDLVDYLSSELEKTNVVVKWGNIKDADGKIVATKAMSKIRWASVPDKYLWCDEFEEACTARRTGVAGSTAVRGFSRKTEAPAEERGATDAVPDKINPLDLIDDGAPTDSDGFPVENRTADMEDLLEHLSLDQNL